MSAINPEYFVLKNGKTVVIRSVEIQDWLSQMNFRNTFKNETIFTWHTPETNPKEEETKKIISEVLVSPKESFIGVFDGSMMIAQIGIHRFLGKDHPWTEHAGRFGVAILKAYWRQGLGAKLLVLMEQEMRRLGYKNIHAEVRETNTAAISLYKKFGFEFTGTIKNAAFINGRYYSDLILFKEL